MKINGQPYRTIWPDPDDNSRILIIDQRQLPHNFIIEPLINLNDAVVAIRDMHVRGAGLIGATAGFGMHLAAVQALPGKVDEALKEGADRLDKSRPTARNLKWAVERILQAAKDGKDDDDKKNIVFATACAIADEDATFCKALGDHGVQIIANLSKAKGGETVNILTHCNAGWLAFVDHGSATAPIYAARDAGIKVHVWVDETRPWNQGARLTAWELQQEKIPCTLITDNAGGHLMQQNMVDVVLVGTDRTTHTGDVANKIGTYLKALAAHDNNVPFYVALPSSTFDWELDHGCDIPIEERSGDEITTISGLTENGTIESIQLTAPGTRALNYSFDVTPARLISGLITERGIVAAEKEAIHRLFPDKIMPGQQGVKKAMATGDKRHFIRLDSLHLLDYLVIDREGRQTIYSMGRTLDVSENGLKLETTQPIAIDDTLLITVGLEEELIDLTGEVKHCEKASGRYATGIEFSDISDEGKRIFKIYTEAFRKHFS
ncbi:MAG: S-methyl-5-thioribose-1-phosphate isomerase [Proteobacteria bacterium]|nr:S-methyl-5-thioribose-1-phosphate isomerase [Pseudomonadota bacterium]MBU1060268.1 S-methyl-5-thioribose-1-phosphate isomerase [Pseudomonadota bacterium]